MATIAVCEDKSRVLADLEFLEKLVLESTPEELYENSSSIYNLSARNIGKIKGTEEEHLKDRYITLINGIVKYLPSEAPEVSEHTHTHTPRIDSTPDIDSRLGSIENILIQTLSYLQKQETVQNDIIRRMQKLDKRISKVESVCVKEFPIPVVYKINFSILAHCNLNCKGCSHFAPIASKHIVPADIVRDDLNQVAKLTEGSVTLLHIFGGEPLLHPNFKQIIKDARNAFPNAKIKVLTNGVLLPSQDESFWVACHDTGVELNVTKYPINLDFEKLEQTALDYNVEYTYFSKSGEVEKTLQKYPLDVLGTQDPRKNFLNCCLSHNCNVVREGRLYYCPVIANSAFFNKRFGTNMILDKRDYLEIDKIDSYDQLLTFLASPKPFCRYCDTKKMKEDIPWELSKRKIKEWT